MADERTEKGRAIDLAMSQIEKQFGKGSIMKLGSKGAVVPIAVISTGAISFDAALGIGGFPRGRVVEIFGPESSGKTTIALQVIGEAQKQGGMAAFVDAEHALDPIYAAKLGVDVDNLLVSQPDYGEQALEIAEALVRSGAIDVLVVDSVAALVPKAELDGEMGDSHVGLQARLMSQALRKLTAIVAKSHTCLVFINQIREKIGVMFGNPETTTGGRALKFYSSVRIDIRRIGAIKDGDQVIGSRTRVKIVKNKTAAPFREAEFDMMYGEGISREGDLLDLAVNGNLVEKSGSWFSYQGRTHWPGPRKRQAVPEREQGHRGQDRNRRTQVARPDLGGGQGASGGSQCRGGAQRYAQRSGRTEVRHRVGKGPFSRGPSAHLPRFFFSDCLGTQARIKSSRIDSRPPRSLEGHRRHLSRIVRPSYERTPRPDPSRQQALQSADCGDCAQPRQRRSSVQHRRAQRDAGGDDIRPRQRHCRYF